jgi:sugar O-acyltransferase (sialic acid O-acetyltransferase NeuD family)
LVVADAALEAGCILAGFLDDDPAAVMERGHPGVPRLGRLEDLRKALTGQWAWIIALGDLRHRRTCIQREERSLTPAALVLHPRAFVSPLSTIGPGVFVGPQAVVHTLAQIGPHSIVNTGAIVEHECRIGANCHIAPGSVLGGRVAVGDDSLIGLGARVLPNLSIGRKCTIGAGAVVTRNVPDGTTIRGVPARSNPQSP